MKAFYDLDWLIAQYRSKKKLKYLYFWGHTPRADGEISNVALANGGNYHLLSWITSFTPQPSII